jgi:hypothetical protein
METLTKVDSNIAYDKNNFKIALSSGGNKLLLEYYLQKKGNVEITAISMNGQKMKTLYVENNQGNGFYQSSADISGLKSGIYIIRLQSGNFSENCKLIISKN